MKVTYYLFQGITATQHEMLKIGVSEDRKIYWLCSKKTDYKFINVSDKFFDTPEEKDLCIKMSDIDFDATIIKTFTNQGYNLVKKTVD